MTKNPVSHRKTVSITDVYIGCESALKRYLRRYLYRPEDVDDMAQETFLRAYSSVPKEELAFPKAYLFRIARNVALRELSKKANRLTDYFEEGLSDGVLSPDGDAEQDLIAQQKIQGYCEAIAQLPPQCRRVFLLRKVHGLSYKEIAANLSISVSAVEKHVALGMERFSAYMENKEGISELDKRSVVGGALSSSGFEVQEEEQ